jgi:hypothetical protein
MTMDKAATAKASTDRRSFLKTGAIVAAPLAIAAPAVALADDGSRARLTQLEDEKAIAALHLEVLRRINRGERTLAEGLTALADEPAHELQIAFADDGRRASCRRVCTATFRIEFAGHSTIEQMHRLQGQGLHSHDEARVLVADYSKGKDGWAIETLRLA